MEKKKCACGKVIEAYNKKQADYLLSQHKLSKSHKNALKIKKVK